MRMKGSLMYSTLIITPADRFSKEHDSFEEALQFLNKEVKFHERVTGAHLYKSRNLGWPDDGIMILSLRIIR